MNEFQPVLGSGDLEATDKGPEMSVHDIFLLIRRSMGHTWPVGTFNRSKGQGEEDAIEGEYRVIDDQKQLNPPEVTNG